MSLAGVVLPPEAIIAISARIPAGHAGYGCYNRKTKGLPVCANTKSISRYRIEARVLARLRIGLLRPDLADQFAGEVLAHLKAASATRGPDRAGLSAKLDKVNVAIDRLLDALEMEADSASLRGRLKAREADRDQLQNQLSATIEDIPAGALPTVSDLIRSYQDQVARLEALLTGSDGLVEANRVLRDLLGQVVVTPDPEAPDGLRVEIRSTAARVFF